MQCYISTLIAFLCLPLITQAQFCTGTLGDNIFLEGDFGTGTANLLSPNPNIAPGYNYTFSVPPVDGQYVLTNNTNWPGLYPSWLAIGDNSTDPNGYMMVVNASNSPGLFYEQTISGLCENTLYEFSADIINLIKIGIANHIDPDVSFLLDGVELFSTGNIPKTNNWTTYGFTFMTGLGQQSLTLSLRNNAPGGNGNDLALDNISFRACGPETSITPLATMINLCEDDGPVELQATITGNQYVNPSFQWQQSFDGGVTWVDIVGANGNAYTHPQSMAGSYYYRFLVADGVGNLSSDKCRVNSNPKIINVGTETTMQLDTILCEGQTLTIGNSTYVESGIYIDTFASFLGCDSILITDLTVMINADFMAELIVNTPCPGLADGSISVENISGGMPPYNFIFDGIDVGNTTFFPNLAGGQTYTVIIQDAIGCSTERSVFVETSDDFIANFLVLPPCSGLADGSISIENVSGGTPPYNFIFEGVNVGTTTLFSDLAGGATYSVVIQDDVGCSTEQFVFIENTPDFMVDLLVKPACPNLSDGSISIENVNGGTPPYNYTFDGIDVGTTTLFPDLAGGATYSIVIQDDVGCSTERSVFIENTDDFMADLLVTTPCPNLSDGSISIENVSGGTPPYNFIFEGMNFGTTTLFPDLAGGQTYTVVIQDANGCSTERSAFIENPSDLILELGEDRIIDLGETVEISPFYNFTPSEFSWQPNILVDCLDFESCDELTFLPTESQQVILNLLVGDGCSVSDSIFIEVLDVRKVYLPNAFSPNADGRNDFFTVFANTSNVQMVEELKVFNRWGALIFENEDFLPNVLQNGWDGTFNGEPASLGVYIYTATVRFADEQVLRFSGDVSIVK